MTGASTSSRGCPNASRGGGRSCSSMRARGSWVWERWLGYFASRGWEGHALNLPQPLLVDHPGPLELSIESYTEDVVAAIERIGPGTVAVGHGLGGLLVLKAIERERVSAYVLLSPEPPRELRTRPDRTS